MVLCMKIMGAEVKLYGSRHRMSWINLVEIYLAKLTRECLRRRAVSCVIDFQIVINSYVERSNVDLRPYVRALGSAT